MRRFGRTDVSRNRRRAIRDAGVLPHVVGAGRAVRRADFSDVAWYRTPRGSLLVLDGNVEGGHWWSSGNRIVVAQSGDPRIVRHEMLHAILQTGSHAASYFGERCGAYVHFPSGEETFGPADAPTRSADAVLDVTVRAHSTPVSFAATNGRITVLVEARSRASGPVWVELPVRVLSTVRADPDAYGLVGFTRDRQFFASGQRRTIAVDFIVARPGVYRLLAQYGTAQSPVAELTVVE